MTYPVDRYSSQYAYSFANGNFPHVARCKIVDSTLRKIKIVAGGFWNSTKKAEIAKALDEVGVDYVSSSHLDMGQKSCLY